MGVVRRQAPLRGEVWIVDLEPTIGREIQKVRPCVVVSPDPMNRFLRTCTVVPLTSGSRPAPFRVPAAFAGKAGFLLPEQMRTVDWGRLKSRAGEIEDKTLHALLRILREMFED